MTTNRAASSRLERSAHAEVEIILHPIPTADSKPYIIVFGPDQQLWFCESGTSKIGRMNPGNGSFVEFDEAAIAGIHSSDLGCAAFAEPQLLVRTEYDDVRLAVRARNRMQDDLDLGTSRPLETG